MELRKFQQKYRIIEIDLLFIHFLKERLREFQVSLSIFFYLYIYAVRKNKIKIRNYYPLYGV